MEKIGKIFRQIAEESLKKNLTAQNCFIIVRYSGIKASEMNNLRQSLRQRQARLFILKNSISRRAFDSIGLNEFSKMLNGPCGIVYGNGDPIDISKALYNFIKTNENLKIEGGLLEQRPVSPEEVISLAKLSSKGALYGMLTGLLKSPVNSFVWVLNGMIKKLLFTLEQIKEKKKQTKPQNKGGEDGGEKD